MRPGHPDLHSVATVTPRSAAMAVSPVRKLFVGEQMPSALAFSQPLTTHQAAEGMQGNGNIKARRRPKGQSLHKIKGFAAWSRRAEAALLRREMERASPARVSLSDDTLAPFQLRAPYETYFRHGAPLAQRQAAEAAVEEVLNTMQHSTEDAQLLASLGGTLRSAVAAPESFKHGEASTVRGGQDDSDQRHSVVSRALGGASSDAALEAWVAAAARGEAPPPDTPGRPAASGGESVIVGGKQLTVSMSDDGLRDAASGASLDLGLSAHRRKAAMKQAIARALTTADGRPPWNSDATPLHPPLHSGQMVGGVSKHVISHDSSHKYFSPGAVGPVAFMHSPAEAGTRHPLRSSQTSVSSPVFSAARGSAARAAQQQQSPRSRAGGAGTTPPPQDQRTQQQQQQLAAAARRGSMLPVAGASTSPIRSTVGGAMGAISEGGADSAYYAQLYQAMDASPDKDQHDDAGVSPSPSRRPPPSIPGHDNSSDLEVITSSRTQMQPAAQSPIRAPARTRQRLSALERSRRAVKAAMGTGAYI